jgi:hypothetical protein
MEEQFPERISKENFFALISNNKSLDDYRLEETEIRLNKLTDWSTTWYYVRGEEFDVYQNIYDSMYVVHLFRKSWGHSRIAKQINEYYKENSFNLVSNHYSTTFSVIGIPGVGKSRMVLNILEKCFKAIDVTETGLTLKYVYTNCSDVGSIKQLLTRFIEFVNETLGTKWPTITKGRGEDFNAMEGWLASIVNNHKIHVWIIDEIDSLIGLPFDYTKKVNGFLRNLSRITGLSIVFIGTPDAINVLAYNYQVARRADGIGSIILEKFNYDFNKNITDDVNKDWVDFMSSLWRRQVLREIPSLSEELIYTYYTASAGIPGKAITLHVRAQREALKYGIEFLNFEFIKQVDKQSFSLSANMVRALVSGKRDLIDLYPDLSLRLAKGIETIRKQKLEPKEFAELINTGEFTGEEKSELLKLYLSLNDKKKN